MAENLKSMDEIRALAEAEQKRAQQSVENQAQPISQTAVVSQSGKKSISEISVEDIKVQIDQSKSMEQQAEDVVGAMATAKAVQDESTAEQLTQKKADELLAKAEKKKKEAEAGATKAEVDKQEANRSKYEGVLKTFNIKTHLPTWLLYIMVAIFSPIYIVLMIGIGVPCGIVNVFIDNIDNIVVRYQKADDKSKPKIKTVVWIILVLLVLGLAAFVLLRCLGKI